MVGDFNCDFAQREGVIINSPTGNKLQRLLLQFGLCVANYQPTRVTGSSSTLIDLIITNKGLLEKAIFTCMPTTPRYMLLAVPVMQ